MAHFRSLFLTLGLVFVCNCDIELRIYKNTADNYEPLRENAVGEAGTDFELLCELFSNEDSVSDDQLIFMRARPSNGSVDKNCLQYMQNYYSHSNVRDVNRSILKFKPFMSVHEGNYICCSLKYKLGKVLSVVAAAKPSFGASYGPSYRRGPESCYNKFLCGDRKTCISKHYVCDGLQDCKDGADERCDGDPCKDKLMCDTGRCISKDLCCDKNTDANCSVLHRHPCCKVSTEIYPEELYPRYNVEKVKPNTGGMSYLFFSLFILTGVLVTLIAIILIMSKIIFAKKLHCTQQRNILHLHDIPLRTNVITNVRSGTTCCYCSQSEHAGVPTSHSFCSDNNEASEPLILTRQLINRPSQTDQPPSYADVVNNLNPNSLCEPPPPYSSREHLNRTLAQAEVPTQTQFLH